MVSGRITLHDVAAEAGVSKSSVSNVIRDQPHVRASVRKRVYDAIDKLGYRPLAIGQNLVTGSTGVVALAIPNFAQPYFAEVARAAVAAASRHGLKLIVQQTDNDLLREREVADAWNLGAADGLIFSPSTITDEEIEERRGGMPLVLLGERSKLKSVDRVGIDSVAIAKLATQHLIEQGRRHVAMIGHKDTGDPFVVSEREEGFHKALAEAGLVEAAPIGYVQDWTRQDGEAAMAALLERGDRIDAIFCANDLLALGAMKTLAERGIAVPADVTIIAVDDIEEASFANPSLSSVFIDRTWMMDKAFALLSARLKDPLSPPQQVEVPFRLVARSSTGA